MSARTASTAEDGPRRHLGGRSAPPASARVFASGLRNPNGLAWEPQTGALWTAVNERDELGSDLVPDYMTSVKDGALLRLALQLLRPARRRRASSRSGPTWSPRRSRRTTRSARTPPRSGLAFDDRQSACRADIADGAFIGQHGSWNRKPRSGYKVIFVPFANGKPSGQPLDVLTGFLNADGEAQGRPVGVAIDKQGALLVADDVGNAIWRVTPAAKSPRDGDVASE